MNHSAASHPHQLSEPPRLSPRLRAGVAIASAMISAVVLSSVVLGITATPELVGELVAAPVVAGQG